MEGIVAFIGTALCFNTIRNVANIKETPEIWEKNYNISKYCCKKKSPPSGRMLTVLSEPITNIRCAEGMYHHLAR